MIWLLIGYMWLFLHRPFEIWPWLGAMRIERVYMIVTILYWVLCANKCWVSNRLHACFAMLAVAIVASTLMSPYTAVSDAVVQNWFKIGIFYVLLLTSVRNQRDLQVLLCAFVACFGLYMLHSLWEFRCGRHIYRMGIPRMVGVDATFNDPNTFGNSVVYALAMVAPVWVMASRKWHYWALAGYVALGVMCVGLTGSRSSFVGLGALAFSGALLTKHRKKAIVGLMIAVPLFWATLPENLKNRYLTIIDPARGPRSAQASADGRMWGFKIGMELWSENPICGVGPGATGAWTGHGMQAHNLYGQVAGELGTAGVLALLCIVGAISWNAREAWRLGKRIPGLRSTFMYSACLAVFVSLLLLLLLGWGAHNMFRYTWLWYGSFQIASLHFLRQEARAVVAIDEDGWDAELDPPQVQPV